MGCFDDFVEKLRTDIQKTCGNCYAGHNKCGTYSLYKYHSEDYRGVFAWVHEQKNRFRIATRADWAEHAGVDKLADEKKPGLIFFKKNKEKGKGLWFDISRSNNEGYEKAVEAMGRICLMF